ncbi:ras protein [Mycena rosella]|uniref:Ras protein n=1 Tax=Mycena rosella TaxID=1033263 RepID=A0AAD7G8J5_MYCRO|nr:ras protein [Mycena rosella]
MDQFSITLLGQDGAGKTALADRFTHNRFVEVPTSKPKQIYDPTIELYHKQWAVDSAPCFIEVLDGSGSDEGMDSRLIDRYIRKGQGFFLMYSVASRDSFEVVDYFWKWVLRIKSETALLILLATKCDWGALGRAVPTEEGAALARQFGCPFLEVSAKTGINVERAFSDLVRLLRQNTPEATAPQESSERTGNKKCIVL